MYRALLSRELHPTGDARSKVRVLSQKLAVAVLSECIEALKEFLRVSTSDARTEKRTALITLLARLVTNGHLHELQKIERNEIELMLMQIVKSVTDKLKFEVLCVIAGMEKNERSFEMARSYFARLFDFTFSRTTDWKIFVVHPYEHFFSVLMQVIRNKTALKKFEIPTHNLEAEYFSSLVRQLSDVLKNNTTIEELRITGNLLDCDMELLANSLRENTGIKRLNLSFSAITQNLYLLIEGLKENNSIRSLDLRSNLLTTEEARDIADLLRYNSTLQEIYLDRNCIGEEGVLVLVDVLEENDTLQILSLENMLESKANLVEKAISPGIITRIRSLLDRNNRIQSSFEPRAPSLFTYTNYPV